MGFTGAWRAGSYDQPQQYARHTADPAHSEVDTLDPTLAGYAAPKMEDMGDSNTEIGFEYPGLEWVAQTAGRVLDRSDTRDHDANGNPAQSQGAELAGYYGEPSYQFQDERYTVERSEGLPGGVSEINPVALQRGRNGLGLNNPQGFRLGWNEQASVDRKFAVGERVHDHRIIFPDVAYAGADTPAVSRGPYPVPFTSLARIMRNVNQKPVARREPPPMGQPQVTDGSPVDTSRVDLWVVG